jgi:hypothetical protein
VNQFDAAHFEALGPWITGFEFGGSHYGGQYRADTDFARSSFQPTIGSLADMLWAAGFSEISLLEKSMTPDGNGPAVLLKAVRTSDTGG